MYVGKSKRREKKEQATGYRSDKGEEAGRIR